MTYKRALCHCEERSDEAISALATDPFAGMTGSRIRQSRNFDLARWWIWGIIYKLVYLGSGGHGWRVWVYFGEAGIEVLINKEQVLMEDTK